MPRISAFRGTYQPNRRPYVTLTCDAYVTVQGQTETIACGECNRKIDINRYVTGINSEANVESAPGSCTINLSIPDNDINEFYVDGQFVLISMMEIEVYSKGYYTVGGFPQYYRTFWGLINNVQLNWSDGATTVTIACRDILRWWELTNVIVNPAFLDIPKTSSGYNLFQNQFSGMNPYTVIIALAKEAMGDFSLTTGSFTSFRPEDGPERAAISSFSKDIMAYWQLKFGNIWNNLVLFGSSGQSYTFSGEGGNVSPFKIAKQIFEEEARQLSLNPETAEFKIQPHEVAAFKVEVSRAGDVDFFQNETQSKLAIANTCRDQAGGYEFYCDTTGDIIFKPPFYNLNVMPNKPVSWIQDFEIIDDSITESEQEVYTHITSSGNAFGGVTDWGINDDITTPRTGVVDWHLLKRYGWRRLDVQVQWAGNPRKLFFHLLDWLDRINAKRESGTVTIPYRPEIRMGFPVWIPKYDSFFYIQGVSHQYSPGGQATTTLTLIAKRSKFIAPKNIGIVKSSGSKAIDTTNPVTQKKETTKTTSYTIEFPSDIGVNAGIVPVKGQSEEYGGPAILRNPKTGKLVGFPNVVMTYRTSLDGSSVQRTIEKSGSTKMNKPIKQQRQSGKGAENSYNEVQRSVFSLLQTDARSNLLDRLRLHRYESGMTNAGVHDYAHDVDGIFKEFAIIPTDSITWGAGTKDPNAGTEDSPDGVTGVVAGKDLDQRLVETRNRLQQQISELDILIVAAKKELNKAIKDRTSIEQTLRRNTKKRTKTNNELSPEEIQAKEQLDVARANEATKQANFDRLQAQKSVLQLRTSNIRKLKALNTMIRPVSDEFGFEVIGHQRYGRGAFIDRGKLQLSDPNSVGTNPNVVNQLGIQFAAQGGIITDNPVEQNLGQESTNFAQLYETMTPDEYVTGASFRGANYNSTNHLADVNFTSQQTYTDSINNTVTRANKGVFIEADALKRSKTLEELRPIASNGLDDVGFSNCACGLGRAEWLSILPLELLSKILKPTSSEQGEALRFSDIGQSRFGSPGQTGTSLPSSVQTSLQDASNGKFTPLNSDEFFNPDESILILGVEAVEQNKAQTDARVDAINKALESASRGIPVTVDPSLLSNSSIDADELNSYINDSSRRVQSLGITMSGQDSASRDIGEFIMNSGGSSGFFQLLSQFLREKFERTYLDSNSKREAYAINAGRNVSRPDEGTTDSNILRGSDVLGGETNTLFDRASRGDPDAIGALQNEANFNFGLTQNGLQKFKDQSINGGAPTNQSGRSQPPILLRPAIGDLLNPSSVPGSDAGRVGNIDN